MATLSIKIKGLDELVANAKRIGPEMERELVVAMTKATILVKEEAKRIKSNSFKNQTGSLRRSIVSRVESANRGVVSTDIPYAEFVEFGTRPHTITPKNGNYLAWKAKSGDMVFARKVNHPGTRPYPFMQPALEDKQDEILKQYEQLGEKIVRMLAQ